MGMTFPEWNGSALDMGTFDRLVWGHPDLQPLDPTAGWNIEDIDSFLQWHRQSALHHNYVVGGALMRKKERKSKYPDKPRRNRVRVHQLDTGLGSGNTGDDAMFLGAHAHLPSEFVMSTEVHSLARASILPRGVNYILATNGSAVEESIRAADMALLIGDTPIMDQWGLEWPLQSNAVKLRICHHLGKPVHALGVGVDRLVNPEGLRIFQDCYAPIESWSVRSLYCKEALQEMGIPAEKIALGADWAWLLSPAIDREWAREWLNRCGAAESGIKIGINLVNEIWKDNQRIKDNWARLLDCLIERYGAQVFFFCNESRPGEYYDRAAAEDVRSRMRHPSILLPDRYYQPAEIVSLISLMSLTISQRYHFTLFSVLADVVPLSIQRGQKMRDLNQELGLPPIGDMMQPDSEGILREMEEILQDSEPKLHHLRLRRIQLATRAHNNLSLLMQHLPSYH
jgi:polysaccharide pyruvyl transferase WcaK-like protein